MIDFRRKSFAFLAVMLVPAFCLGIAGRLCASSASAGSAIKPFLGRWDLTIKTPMHDLPSWIDVSEHEGQPRVVLVGVSEHATRLKKVSFKNGELEFLSPKEEEGFSQDTLFKGKVEGGRLVGTASGPDGTSWRWSGSRAPSLKRSAVPKWGKPIRLFNGRNLDGWRFSAPAKSSVWKVVNGILVKDGSGPDIITNARFEDFKLHLEFKCGPMANSGVYLRGRYEVQIETDSASEPPSHHTGGVYGYIAPHPELPRRAGVWQTFDITFVGRTVTVVQNGTTVINHREIPGITGGALDSHEGLPGPIYLQGSEKGVVSFRNIVLTPAN
jgi:3-keto-disaccharide hydrolase